MPRVGTAKNRVDRVTPAPAPLRSIHWKIFPDLLTSQPCHLPTAAWIQNAALNSCPAGRNGLSWAAVVLDCTVFSFLLILGWVFAHFLLSFFFPLMEEKKDYGEAFFVGFMWIFLVLTTLEYHFP